MKYHLVSELKDVADFEFCPFCGSEVDYLGLYIGDFTANTECLNCDKTIGFYILEEVRDRFADWKKRIFD